MRMIQRVLPLVAVVALLAGCKSKQQAATTVNEAVKVEAMPVEMREIDDLGTFTATVEAEVENQIAPQSPGRIKKIYAEVGDYVSRGQKLVEMDAVNLEQTRLQMENNRIEFERVDELYQVGGVSKSMWDSKKLTWELSVTAYENLVENTTLTSPIGGVVTVRNYDSGDMYSGDPIYIVSQIQPVKLIVNISESLFTVVKKNMEVEVKFDVYGDETFKGAVWLVHPSIDPTTRTFPVEIRIQNNGNRIRPGMFARATFNYGKLQRLIVPDRSIVKQTGSGERFVYACKDGVSTLQKVELGRRIGDEYEVLGGVQQGDMVAITGQNRLTDGGRVEIVNR